MEDTFPSSWHDPRYIAAILSVVAVAILVVYAEWTVSPPSVRSIATSAVVIGLAMWIGQVAYKRMS